MSEPTPPPPAQRRNWTLPIVAGVLALVVVAVVCVGGGVTAYLALRKTAGSGPPAPTPAPSRAVPSPTATAAPAPKTQAECIYGDWLETSYVGTAEIYGYDVQLYGKGVARRIAPDGTSTAIYDNAVRAGTADGSNFEVIHNGKITVNVVIDADKIHYSNPRVEGTTTWKVDGKTRDTENMRVLLTSDTFKCSGDQLRVFGESYSVEYQRIRPPGVPV